MTESAAIAADLKADGQPMILSRTTPGQFDPVAGRMLDAIEQRWTVYGITANYSSSSMAASQGLIQSGDKKAIIGATVEPTINDTLKIGGKQWRVIAIDDLSPQGETLLYTLQIRR